jgi:hypothetical protein
MTSSTNTDARLAPETEKCAYNSKRLDLGHRTKATIADLDSARNSSSLFLFLFLVFVFCEL